VNENISVSDAFRSATGEIHDRIEELSGSVHKIYCRDNKRVKTDILSRELIEETQYESTNDYKKLANITLDKNSGELQLSDVDYSSGRNIQGYFDKANRLFEMYKECVGNRSIETMAEKYISRLHAIGISKEIRNVLRLKEGDSVEMCIFGNTLCLQKAGEAMDEPKL